MKKTIITIIILAALIFAWWTISPLFITTEVNDVVDDEIAALLDTPTPAENVEEVVPPTNTFPPIETSTPTEEPITSVSEPFSIEDTKGHPASGNVRVINTPDETLVRYESYEGTNGPDLYVYLAKDLDAQEFVSLGRAKGNKGNINYSIPSDIDVDEYPYVMTWCKAFGVLFDYAEIN